MTTRDIDIELPPEFRSANSVPVTVATIKRERMEEILRDAIEADRKRRGETVAWLRKNGVRFIAEIEPRDDSEVPLYAAPQPAEPESCFCDRMYPDSNPDASCGDCPIRDYGAKAAEPVKVPSVDEIMDAVMAYGSAHSNPQTTATERHARLNDVRALLARYCKGTP